MNPLSKDAAIQLLRDHMRALLGDAIDHGHSKYCTAPESDNIPLHPLCACGHTMMIGDALLAMRKTCKRGTHHYSMVLMDNVCVKCGADYLTATNFCPSDEGMEP